MTLIGDSAGGRHDVSFPACSAFEYRQATGSPGHTNCAEIQAESIRRFGLTPDHVHDPLNLWMEGGGGRRQPAVVAAGPAAPGDRVELLAQVEVVASFNPCGDDLFDSSGYEVAPVLASLRDGHRGRAGGAGAGPPPRPAGGARPLEADPGYVPGYRTSPLRRRSLEVELPDGPARRLDALRRHGGFGESDGEIVRAVLFSWWLERHARMTVRLLREVAVQDPLEAGVDLVRAMAEGAAVAEPLEQVEVAVLRPARPPRARAAAASARPVSRPPRGSAPGSAAAARWSRSRGRPATARPAWRRRVPRSRPPPAAAPAPTGRRRRAPRTGSRAARSGRWRSRPASTPPARRSAISASSHSRMKPVFLTQVPVTIAQPTRSGRSCATCTAISDPIERPISATGGVHTASISAIASSAWVVIGHGGRPAESVRPTPRAS